MRKLYIIRLTKQERVELQSVVKNLKGTGQKVRRAQILLKADADGPNWTDARIAEAYSCQSLCWGDLQFLNKTQGRGMRYASHYRSNDDNCN
jgi:hypothetical protein